MPKRSATESAARLAMWGSAAMIAHQVGGKATRDALFLSNFDIRSLPVMVMASAVLTVVAVMLAARAMTALTPAKLVPATFIGSAFLTLAEWAIAFSAPAIASVLVYLHIASLGSVLISGFWSMVSERFDPRSAKKQIGWIGGAGTLGGLAGGILAERVAATLGVTAMLPFLAAIDLFCAWACRGLRSPARVPPPAEDPASPGEPQDAEPPLTAASALRIFRQAGYLRTLAALVVLASISAGLLDYVFKAQVTAAYGRGENLARFFGLFYSGAGLLTFLLQAAFGRRCLEKLGLAKTVAILPGAVLAGTAGALLSPGLSVIGTARGAELALRNSLYRNGYELLFTPIPAREKRAAKPIVDVGFDRLGDLLGGGIVRLALILGAAFANRVILLTGVALAAIGLWIAGRLDRAYIDALEQGLRDRASELELPEMQDSTTQSVLVKMLPAPPSETGRPEPEAAPLKTRPPAFSLDPVTRRVHELRSEDPQRVRRALRDAGVPGLAAHIIPLLAWDEVCEEAARALQAIAPKIVGQLTDALLDPEQEFAVRRRIPRVLAACATERAAGALLRGLGDKRFEVRFRCGRALASIQEKNPAAIAAGEPILEAVMREVSVSKGVWESYQVLDRLEETDGNTFVDEFLRDRTNRGLQHVFTLLSLVLPKEPLRIAFWGLHTADETICGTALEYLESILPAELREHLWPFLEDRRPKDHPLRSREEILSDLMRSNQSVRLNLAELQRDLDERRKPGGAHKKDR